MNRFGVRTRARIMKRPNDMMDPHKGEKVGIKGILHDTHENPQPFHNFGS